MPYREQNSFDKRNNLFLPLFSIALIIIGGIFLAQLRWPQGLLLFLGFCAIVLISLTNWQINKFGYKCSACHHEFDINMKTALLTPHLWRKKYLKCPKCEKVQWAEEIVKDK